MKRRFWLAGAALLAAVLLAGCGDSSPYGGGDSTPKSSGMTVTVAEPAAGATVTVPFTVKLTSSEPLGPTSSGKHHVHIWFDGDSDHYTVVESDTTQVTTALAAGPHTMYVSLRNANHSAAGAETTVAIVVGAGGSTSPAPSSGTPTPPSYQY